MRSRRPADANGSTVSIRASRGSASIAVSIEVTDDLFDNVAISISGPKPKFDSTRIENELVPMLEETAHVIELKQRHY